MCESGSVMQAFYMSVNVKKKKTEVLPRNKVQQIANELTKKIW
jgi:hypothetical protein